MSNVSAYHTGPLVGLMLLTFGLPALASNSVSFNIAGAKAAPTQDTVSAPVEINIVGINAIKYNVEIKISQTVTETTVSPTTIAAIFQPPKPTPKPTAGPPTLVPSDAVKVELDNIDTVMSTYAKLADDADTTLATDTSATAISALLKSVGDLDLKVHNVYPFAFPSNLDAMKVIPDPPSADQKLLVDRMTKRPIETSISNIDAIKKRLDGLILQGGSAFVRTQSFGCGFSQTSSNISVDEKPVINDPSITSRTVSVTSADCSSPIKYSTGVGVSSIPVNTIGFVSSSPTVSPTPVPTTPPPAFVNRFGYTEQSAKQTVIPVLIHARIYEGQYGGFYLTAGGVGGGSGGYLFGGSFSLGGTTFLTVADHFGSVSTLSGGYKIGDIVPPNLASAPTVKSSQSALFFSITFSISAPTGK